MKSLGKHYLSIDPGKNGGLCIVRFDGTPLEWVRMPAGTGRIIDWITTAKEKYPNLVMVTEKSQAMPRQGIVGAFRYGVHFGAFGAIAALLRLPYHEVRPMVWKRSFGLSAVKRDSLTACRTIFPMVNLVPEGCRTEHDGIAEALLIAEWARQKNL
jgi:hypothetical protein